MAGKTAPDPVLALRGVNSSIMSIVFMEPDPQRCVRYLAAGTLEGFCHIWDLKTKCLVSKWAAHKNSSLLWLKSTCSKELWTQGRSDSVKLWDVSTSLISVRQFEFEDYLGFGHCDVYIFGGSTLLAIPGPGQVGLSVWDTKTKHKICTLTPDASQKYGTVMQVKWVNSQNKSLLLALYENSELLLWDWTNKRVISRVVIKDTPISLEYDQEIRKGICGTSSEKVFSFALSDGKELSVVKEFSITNPGVAACTSRPDGKLFATGGWDHRIRLFSWKSCKPLAVLMHHRKTVECLAYSKAPVEQLNCGYILAAGSSDESVSLWSIYN